MHLVQPTTGPLVQRDRLIRMHQVEALTGLKKTTIYSLIRKKSFPQGVHVTPRCVAWPESRVLQFVQQCIADSDKRAAETAAGGEA